MGAVAAVARAMGGGGNSAPGVPADRLAPVRGWTLAILPNLHCAPRRSSPRCAAAPRQSRVLPPLELLQPHSTPSTPLRGLDHQMLLPDAPIAAPRRHGAILRVAARDARSLGASPGVLAPQAAPIGGSLCVGKTLLRRLDGVGYLVEAYPRASARARRRAVFGLALHALQTAHPTRSPRPRARCCSAPRCSRSARRTRRRGGGARVQLSGGCHAGSELTPAARLWKPCGRQPLAHGPSLTHSIAARRRARR